MHEKELQVHCLERNARNLFLEFVVTTAKSELDSTEKNIHAEQEYLIFDFEVHQQKKLPNRMNELNFFLFICPE